MKMLRLLGNRIAIAPLPKPARSAGGIHLLEGDHRPWVKTDDEMQYQVIAIGPGRYHKGVRLCPEVRPGDRVLMVHPINILHDLDDGTHRLIVDADQVQMIF